MKKNFLAAFVAIATLCGIQGLGMSSKTEQGLTAANVEALSRSEIGEACGGCSTSYSGRYCCTVDLYGVRYVFNHPRP